MAGKVFALGDPHWFHKKAAEFRELGDVEIMNEFIIETILYHVGARDTLILLGDVVFAAVEELEALLEEWVPTKFPHWIPGTPLPFTLKVTPGNHDRNRLRNCKYINIFQATLEYEVLGYRVILSHIPLHPSQIGFQKRWNFNIHGHLHYDTLNEEGYICASWEQHQKPMELKDLIALKLEKQ